MELQSCEFILRYVGFKLRLRDAWLVTEMCVTDLHRFFTPLSIVTRVPLALHFTVPILEALIFMHQKGMVHCDVKPANVLLTESGSPRLADFGGTSRLEDRTNATGTLPRYIGTPGFLPPEEE